MSRQAYTSRRIGHATELKMHLSTIAGRQVLEVVSDMSDLQTSSASPIELVEMDSGLELDWRSDRSMEISDNLKNPKSATRRT